MSHYTLNSGVRSQTITSRCPICLHITYHPSASFNLTDETVCCSEPKQCKKIYRNNLLQLWDRAQQWGLTNNIDQSEIEIFNLYLLHIGQ